MSRTLEVDGVEVLFFDDAAEWSAWLAANHASRTELWMGFNKVHVRPRGLVWADAVVEALRFGWIDSTARRIDADSTRQRWTPRKPGSNWSAVNLATVERLRAEGRMEPAGLAVWQARRSDREAVYSFESDQPTWTEEQQAALEADPVALTFWEQATEGYRKTCRHWVNQARQATTRERRLAELVDDCHHGRLVKPQRYGDRPAWLARARAAIGLAAEG
ncbi:YdeI/OmpD-associated family protein [Luteococcus peritonei]|uniref:YdeI family protein n=1 Tax=Luteococcus peritonei TaxID=88874 RepID=A0ABW4RY10_9ACTN